MSCMLDMTPTSLAAAVAPRAVAPRTGKIAQVVSINIHRSS